MIINKLKQKKHFIISHRIDIDNNYEDNTLTQLWTYHISLNYICLKNAIKRTANVLLQKLS